MNAYVANNVSTTLSEDITSTSSEAILSDISQLASMPEDSYCFLTIESGNKIEVIKASLNESGNKIDILERGLDGTEAASFASGSIVELRVCAALLEDVTLPRNENPFHYKYLILNKDSKPQWWINQDKPELDIENFDVLDDDTIVIPISNYLEGFTYTAKSINGDVSINNGAVEVRNYTTNNNIFDSTISVSDSVLESDTDVSLMPSYLVRKSAVYFDYENVDSVFENKASPKNGVTALDSIGSGYTVDTLSTDAGRALNTSTITAYMPVCNVDYSSVSGGAIVGVDIYDMNAPLFDASVGRIYRTISGSVYAPYFTGSSSSSAAKLSAYAGRASEKFFGGSIYPFNRYIAILHVSNGSYHGTYSISSIAGDTSNRDDVQVVYHSYGVGEPHPDGAYIIDFGTAHTSPYKIEESYVTVETASVSGTTVEFDEKFIESIIDRMEELR